METERIKALLSAVNGIREELNACIDTDKCEESKSMTADMLRFNDRKGASIERLLQRSGFSLQERDIISELPTRIIQVFIYYIGKKKGDKSVFDWKRYRENYKADYPTHRMTIKTIFNQ